MKDKAFQTLIESINAQLEVLSENGYKIYDTENPEFFISNIRFDKEDNLIKFDTVEDPFKECEEDGI